MFGPEPTRGATYPLQTLLSITALHSLSQFLMDANFSLFFLPSAVSFHLRTRDHGNHVESSGCRLKRGRKPSGGVAAVGERVNISLSVSLALGVCDDDYVRVCSCTSGVSPLKSQSGRKVSCVVGASPLGVALRLAWL